MRRWLRYPVLAVLLPALAAGCASGSPRPDGGGEWTAAPDYQHFSGTGG